MTVEDITSVEDSSSKSQNVSTGAIEVAKKPDNKTSLLQ